MPLQWGKAVQSQCSIGEQVSAVVHGKGPFRITIQPEHLSRQTTYPDQVTIEFTPSSAGNVELTVLDVEGEQAPGSPFKLLVLDPEVVLGAYLPAPW